MLSHSYAKINLALDILGRDHSGYHLIQTIFHEIDLHDVMTFTEIPKGIEVDCPGVEGENLAHKAAELLHVRFKTDRGIHIKIDKNIPIGAGLGGGSGNAATALKVLNEMWDLMLSQSQLAELGAELGMDVPFFIYGGTALGEHFGEEITPLPRIKGLGIELQLPITKTSTKSAYDAIDLELCGKNTLKTKSMLTAIHENNLPEIISNIHNDFQKTKTPPYLTGSGPTTFSISSENS